MQSWPDDKADWESVSCLWGWVAQTWEALTDSYILCQIENALASAFPVATRLELVDKSCCGVSERTAIKWNHFLTFRRFPVRLRRTAGSFNFSKVWIKGCNSQFSTCSAGPFFLLRIRTNSGSLMLLIPLVLVKFTSWQDTLSYWSNRSPPISCSRIIQLHRLLRYFTLPCQIGAKPNWRHCINRWKIQCKNLWWCQNGTSAFRFRISWNKYTDI
jgi:hypothetical protein